MGKKKSGVNTPDNFRNLSHDGLIEKDVFKNEAEWKMAKFILDKNISKLNLISRVEVENFLMVVRVLVEKKVPPRNICEVRMGKILVENGIYDFTYSKKFTTKRINPDGKNWEAELPDEVSAPKGTTENFREVDFYLDELIKIPLCGNPTQALEVKGGNRLDMNCWRQRRELRDSDHKINTFMVLWQYLNFWEKYGFLKLKIPKRPRSKTLILPTEFHVNSAPDADFPVDQMIAILRKSEVGFMYPKDKFWENIIFLKNPAKIFWSTDPVEAIMVVNGDIDISDFLRRKLLSSRGINTFLSLPQHRGFWERCGFTRQIKHIK